MVWGSHSSSCGSTRGLWLWHLHCHLGALGTPLTLGQALFSSNFPPKQLLDVSSEEFLGDGLARAAPHPSQAWQVPGMCQSQGTCSACFPQPPSLSPASRGHELCPGQVCGSFNSSCLKFRGKSRLWVNKATAESYETTFPPEQRCHCHPTDESCHLLQLCSQCLNTCS